MDRTLACEAGNLGSTPNGDTNKIKISPRRQAVFLFYLKKGPD